MTGNLLPPTLRLRHEQMRRKKNQQQQLKNDDEDDDGGGDGYGDGGNSWEPASPSCPWLSLPCSTPSAPFPWCTLLHYLTRVVIAHLGGGLVVVVVGVGVGVVVMVGGGRGRYCQKL